MPRTARPVLPEQARPERPPVAGPAEGVSATDAGRDEPIALPPVWVPPPRPPFPVFASVVPLAGAVGLWLVTGSVLALWFALLGPVIAVATLADAALGRRRSRRAADRAAGQGRAAAAEQIERRHRAERERLRARHPDVASFLLHGDEVWRAVPGRAGMVVVGTGYAASEVRVAGGAEDLESTALRQRARLLAGAPITVPIVSGIAVAGSAVLATAAVRALVLQLCLSHPPGELHIDTGRRVTGWITALPHARVPAPLTLAVLSAEDPVPPGAGAVIVRLPPGAPAPTSCAAVLAIEAPGRARLDHNGEVREVVIEALARGQAEDVVDQLTHRARSLGHPVDGEHPVLLAEHLSLGPRDRSHGLRAVIGREGDAACTIDLVEDGPHAVVAGVTGSGKSELLVSWVLALCAGRSTRDVALLLADFKGGTAFDGLAELPHVTGVITDLDGGGARRAIESLQAEVRWREGELARVGARDIRDPRVELPRLVIVVDEFAALLGAHPEVQAVFTDVAARGRALGMHLILGTQRVAGVVRESLLANLPLRISLRVTDSADSRAVIGTDEAAHLPGGPAGAGRALVRRAGDRMPHSARIALAADDDLPAVIASASGPDPRRPWLPDLPAIVALDDLDRSGGDFVLGLIDEPERQRQRTATLAVADQGLLVLGGAGTGRSTLLDAIAAQCGGPLVRIPSTAEGAWDAVADLAGRAPAPGTVVLADDLDAMVGALPPEYAVALLDRLEHLARSAGSAGILVVASLRRLSGPAVRVAELLPRRALLSMPSRAEHIAAGGEGNTHAANAPAGRGRLDGRPIQFAVAGRPMPPPGTAVVQEPATQRARTWIPSGPTAVVARRSSGLRDILRAWEAVGVVAVSVADAVRMGEDALLHASVPHVVVGGGEDWQRQWALLSAFLGDHDLLVDSGCAAEYRVLTGDRELPPYCAPGRSQGWLRTANGPVRRVVLPSGDPLPGGPA